MKTNNLNDLLSQISGSKICSLRTKTALKTNKKSRTDGTPFPYSQGISKLSVRNVIIGADYSNAVNNQLAREEKVGDFTPENLWKGKGRRVSKFTVEHTESGEKYLCILPKTDSENCNVTKSIYIDNATGNEVEFSSLKDFLPPYNETESQGTDKVVHWQVIKLENVIGLKSGELEYSKE